jgi:hydroxymethylbilane synthase
MPNLRIATRNSPLALWQANSVADALRAHHPELEVTLVEMTTQGDQMLDVALAKIGGKGLFIKELEVALLTQQADIAVHSMKDVPMVLDPAFALPVICARGEPGDAFVANHYNSLAELPQGARVGTSSLRRQSQLLAARPDLTIQFLRGNVGTRLRKLDAGDYDAIILAGAGLERLALAHRIREILPYDVCLPACGQGAVGIECRQDDLHTQTLIQCLNDPATHIRLSAERAMNRRLNGGCQVPIAGFTWLQDNLELTLEGRVGWPDGRAIICATDRVQLNAIDDIAQAEDLGLRLAERLLKDGADAILADLELL